MRTGIFFCTCSGTNNIDFKKLRNSTEADIIEIQEMLCQEPEKIKDVFETKELSRALVACTSKKEVFEALDLDISYVNLREHCGWVHERADATEKASAMICEALNSPGSGRKTVIYPGKDILIIGPASAGFQIACQMSGSANVRLLISEHGSCGSATLNGITHDGIDVLAGNIKDIEGRIGDFRIIITRNPGEDIATLKAGQVLAIGENVIYPEGKKGFYITGEGKDIDETVSLASPAALEIIANTSGLKMDAPVIADMEGCAAGKSGFPGCALCKNACRHGAIDRKGDNIVFDGKSCSGCGACTAVCPQSLFRMEDDIHNRIGYLLQPSDLNIRKHDRRIIMFTCEHSIPLLDAVGEQKIKYPAVLPLFVPDLACISETHILRAFDFGADGIIMLGCGECTDHCSEGSMGFIHQILAEYDLDDRISIIRNDNDVKRFAGSVTSFNKNMARSPICVQKPVLLKNTSNRSILIELISSLAAKTGITPCMVIEDTALPFGEISISSSCTVCGACTSMCPTGALRRDEGSITFVYGHCIACGLCGQACPEKALRMRRVFDMSKLLDTKPAILFKSELQVCASCRKPYMTRAAFDRITDSFIEKVRDDLGPKEQIELIKNQTELLQYCENCRPARAILKMEILS